MGCVPERLHLFPREEGRRGRHGEAALVTPLLLELQIVEQESSLCRLRKVSTTATTQTDSQLDCPIPRPLLTYPKKFMNKI